MKAKELCSSADSLVLGAGLACLDIIRSEKSISYLNGGSCGNVLSALAFLGFKSKLISFSHNDIAWDLMKINFERIGVSIQDLGVVSNRAARIIENLYLESGTYSGHKFLLKCPDCNSDLPKIKLPNENVIRPLLKDFESYKFLFTDRVSSGIKVLKEYFNNRNLWTMYEPNSVRNINALIENTLNSSIVKFSSEKVSLELAENIRNRANSSNIFLIIQTLGKDGLRFCYRKKDNNISLWAYLPAQHIVNLIDTTGAGDWCTAGTIAYLLSKYQNKPRYLTNRIVVSALQYGQALSAISCSFIGGQGLIYAMNDEMESRVNLNQDKFLHFPKIIPAQILLSSYGKVCNTCLI